MIRIAIFASGKGTNAQRFIDYFGTVRDKPPDAHSGKGDNNIVVSLIVSDNPLAKVLERAKKAGIHQVIVDGFKSTSGSQKSPGNKVFINFRSEEFVRLLRDEADFIVLAGFLKLIPPAIIRAFPGKIVNIHPALLPKYGGKGMYGNRVHEAVLANKEKKSGITIHLVNEEYDEGRTIFRKECEVKEGDSTQSLAERIHALEHRYYPEVVERLIRSLPAPPYVA